MTLKTFRDPNGNYKTYKILPPTFRITANADDFNPEPTTSLGQEDPGNGTLTVQGMKALQVIENVDFVRGKRTLVRTLFNFNEGTDNITRTATAKVFLD